MSPIEYIPIMRAYYHRQGLGDYPLYEPSGRPWTPLPRPLRECRVALVCSAGISRQGQRPFRPHGHDDFSLCEIPLDTPVESLIINYDYFDHTDADRDIDCLFPIRRIREVAAEGFVGAICPTAYTMGIGRWRFPDTPEKLQNEVAEEVAGRCRGQGADAVLLVPG